MFICPICNRSQDTLRKISKHIQSKHNLLPKDILFDIYPDLFLNCIFCDLRIKQYKSNSQSRKFCNRECERSWRKTLKQSPETIEKRIKNTDQSKKEESRRITMFKKYGNIYHWPDPIKTAERLSQALTGKKHTEEQHKKIILSKIKNNTIKHSESAKNKISTALQKYWADDNIDHCVTIPLIARGGKGHLQGIYNNIYYRSSYELNFLILCEKYNIIVESASTKEFRIRYEFNGKKKYYYPDFYLPQFDIIVEVKPINLLDHDTNPIKIDIGSKTYKFWLVTEEELDEFTFVNEVNSFEYVLFE